MPLAALRTAVTVVPQQPLVFSGVNDNAVDAAAAAGGGGGGGGAVQRLPAYDAQSQHRLLFSIQYCLSRPVQGPCGRT